ncbi:MAG: hypothetical protein ACJA1D_000175 [Polaribacter sp.]|jgi:hypothetical protein
MKNKDRLKELERSGSFNNEEIEKIESEKGNNFFKSWRYYLIVHLSNEELYYLDIESTENYESADEIILTEKGSIFCFS